MKTRDAFAFRGFDGKRILQRPYFRQFGFSDASDEEILATLKTSDADELASLEEKNQRLNDVFKLLDKLRLKVINHSNKRLDAYRQALKKKIDADAAADSLLQSRYDREQKLAVSYILQIQQAIADLMIAVQNLWQASEKALQAVYRRQFGERLRQARERAGLSRKDLSAACNISVNAINYYENGVREPSLTSLKRFSRTLKTSIDLLLK